MDLVSTAVIRRNVPGSQMMVAAAGEPPGLAMNPEAESRRRPMWY